MAVRRTSSSRLNFLQILVLSLHCDLSSLISSGDSAPGKVSAPESSVCWRRAVSPWWGGSRGAQGVLEPTLWHVQGHVLVLGKVGFRRDAELLGGVCGACGWLPASHLLVLSCLLHCWQQQGCSAEPSHVCALP